MSDAARTVTLLRSLLRECTEAVDRLEEAAVKRPRAARKPTSGAATEAARRVRENLRRQGIRT